MLSNTMSRRHEATGNMEVGRSHAAERKAARRKAAVTMDASGKSRAKGAEPQVW